MTYIRLGTRHPEPLPPLRTWVEDSTGKIFCPECSKVLRSCIKEPFDTYFGYNPPPGHRLLGLLTWIGWYVYHSDFVSQIREELSDSGFMLGRCFDNKGNLVKEYVTCYKQYYIVQRGNKNTNYRICNACGSISEIEWWHGRQYLLKSTLRGQKVVQNATCALYLAEDLFREIDFSAWSDASFERILVLDAPEDGRELPVITV